MHRLLLVPALALALAAATADAQTAARTTARTADETAAFAVVQRLFDAMRAGDSVAARATFYPGAQMGTAAPRQGVPTLRLDSVGAFVRAVGTPHAEVWDERIANEKIHVDGDLAVVWTDYWFFAGERFSHCGVDAFQLARTADGWKIFALADTRRREGCAPAPPKR